MCKIYSFVLLILSVVNFILSLLFMSWDYMLVVEYNLMVFNSTYISFTLLLDWISLLFMSFVLYISSMVIMYSEDYMSSDYNLNRFILLVIMFVLSMMLMILSPNLISILLGWDGLGLVSYCLVIYYQNIKSYNAGMLTALINRIGDVMLLMSISWMMNFGSWNFLCYLEVMKNDFKMELICLMVMLAAMTKSAQMPFSSWLPAAMAAPTPVSALVHSSTLVTAGVYLTIRFNLGFSNNLMYFMLLISLLTMFMSGLGANFEYDLKKIIALSTLSQLGLMMSILALGDWQLAFFHLLTHALFKALLFMCAGTLIHNLGNCQDIRYYGSLIEFMPLTCSFFNICNFSLCGLPFLSGFYSKDLIVEFMSMNFLNLFVYVIFYLSIGLTVCYTFRLMYYSFSGSYNFISLYSLNENTMYMLKGMFGLIFLVIIGGSMLIWMIYSTPIYICLSKEMKLMTLILIMIGSWLGYEMAKFKLSYTHNGKIYKSYSEFVGIMWNLPVLSTMGMNYYPIYLGNMFYKNFDQGWMEYYGSKGLMNMLKYNILNFQFLSFNYLKIYFMLMIIWMLFLLFNFY
nr:NADH dehydrogenase subunit 5 [Spilopyra sumptuosa]